MRTFKYSFITTALLTLSACGGGSDGDNIRTEQISASLAEDTQWQSDTLFTSTAIVISDASNGSISVSDQRVTYTPDENYNGSDSATVEAGDTRYQLSFTVTPVNDAPEVTSTRISLIDEQTYRGELQVTDVDGDDVSLSVATQPEKGTIALGSDGVFDYTLDELSLPAENFVVSASDGTVSVDVTVDLIPAYSSNSEKAAYYYRSAQSHLNAAEQRLTQLSDDVIAQPALIALASGYQQGALATQANDIINNRINSQQGKAEAFRTLALTHDRFNQTDQARQRRLSSFEQYQSYIADNGINNLRPADSQFLLGLINDFNDANDSGGAAPIIAFLDTLATELGGIDNEYSTEFGFIVTSYRNNAAALIQRYVDDRSQANFDAALAAAENVSRLVRQTGYQIQRNGDNAGEIKYQLAPLYGSFALDYFLTLGEFEAAKEMLAWTLSYYTDADYDPDYSYPAKPNADVTLQEYDFPLVQAARYFALLYPELENLPLALIPADSRSKARAEDNVNEARALATILNGDGSNADIEQAIALIEQAYPDDLRGRQEAFSGRTANSPYTGGLLAQMNYQQAAAAMLEAGITLMQSDAYLTEQTSRLYTTSTRGCLKYLQYAANLSLDDSTAADLNATIINACNTIADKLFGQPDGVIITAADQIEAYIDIADLYQFVGDSEGQLAQLDRAQQALQQLPTETDDQWQTLEPLTLRLARAYGSAAAFEPMLALLEPLQQRWSDSEHPAYPQLSESAVNTLAAHLSVIAAVDGNDETVFERPSLIEQVRAAVGVELEASVYQQLLTRFDALTTALSDELIDRFEQLPAAAQVSTAEDVITALSAQRRYADAERLAQLSSFGAAEVEQLLATVSLQQAQQDDFPATAVASVDTDQDGLANFFAEQATDEAIEASGISADNDADNDGIVDEDDPAPLSADDGV
ncbi:Ig-like domain-containing protein [Idiomarina aquatica]|uniref:RapA2 cadherin-like domain-containing protein n=1 Tax=Idiomarina aquatica TaxID=1327752 RepID=A0AA94JDT6_9GAMM|nr:Ig-like domain-containing protein [Idiomarina aquatica]RUO45137.1 hypothetical protein CWE23_03715 [Idiomarina aquatica]